MLVAEGDRLGALELDRAKTYSALSQPNHMDICTN